MTNEQKINELNAAKAAAAERACVEFSKCRWALIKELKRNPGLRRAMDALDAFLESDIALEDFLEGDLLKRVEEAQDDGNELHTYPPKPKFESEYVGAEGEKVELTLKLIKVGGYESSFGGRTAYIAVYTFEDESHNKLVWKTQKGIDGDVCDFFKVKGIVKEHSEYRGEKQTVLTRCKVEAA